MNTWNGKTKRNVHEWPLFQNLRFVLHATIEERETSPPSLDFNTFLRSRIDKIKSRGSRIRWRRELFAGTNHSIDHRDTTFPPSGPNIYYFVFTAETKRSRDVNDRTVRSTSLQPSANFSPRLPEGWLA